MKKKWVTPKAEIVLLDTKQIGAISKLNDAELKIKLEEAGHSFIKKFQIQKNYIQRQIAGGDVLISIGENIANFNGYIELNGSAAFLCNEMKEPRTIDELETALEEKFGIPHKQAVEDVLDFLDELQEKDMVIIL